MLKGSSGHVECSFDDTGFFKKKPKNLKIIFEKINYKYKLMNVFSAFWYLFLSATLVPQESEVTKQLWKYFSWNNSFYNPCIPNRTKSMEFVRCWNSVFSIPTWYNSYYVVKFFHQDLTAIYVKRTIQKKNLRFFAFASWQAKNAKKFNNDYRSQF